MGQFLVRRLIQTFFVLIGTSFVLFACLFLLPGDPVNNLAGGRAQDPATRRALERRYYLDQPIHIQYGHYIFGLVRGDMGESFRLRRPVNDILREKVGNTARLALAALLLEVLIGVTLGVASGVTQNSFWDVAVTTTTTVGLGIPAFVLALGLQHAFGVRLGWLPLSGRDAGIRSYVMPAVTLAAVDTALVCRLVRGAMIEELHSDFFRTGLAKGLSPWSVAVRHGLRGACIPAVTYLGVAFGSLLGGALVAEVVFGWDGVGSTLVTAITARDNPVVLGVAVYAVATFVVVNLAVDLVYAALDPRVRLH